MRGGITFCFRFTFSEKLLGLGNRTQKNNPPTMKTNRLFAGTSALVVLSLFAILTNGCQKKETVEPRPAANEPKGAAIVSAEKTSFTEVTSQLDPGGNLFLYLGTAQWLDGLSTRVSNYRQTFASMPDLKPDDLAKLNQGFDAVTRLIKDSGIEDVSGAGLSSIEIEKGLYRNKVIVHHYPGKGSGFLWKMLGKEPHALTGLDLLPANTALAVFSDVDIPLLWSVAQQEVSESQIPQAQTWLQKLPDAFEQKTKVKWDQFLNSLGGEFGLVLTLDESNNIPIPLPSARAAQIPAPRLMIVLKVNDDTIFNRIDQELKKNRQVVSVDQAGVKMRTMPLSLPLAIELRPTAASSGGYLFIASTDSLIQDALAVKNGQKPGLKSTEEFKRLSQNIPDQGNQFTFMSQRFGQTVYQIQQQTFAPAAQNSPAQAQWLQSILQRFNRPAFTYSVGINTDEGCVTIGNGNQSVAKLVLLPAVAVPGMLAAIAIPNFAKARTVSQQNACINNLRMIDAAKQQWALEKNKSATDVPTADDIKAYLAHSQMPVCPAGGTYTIGAVGEHPQCSVAGHVLP
jgi:hypothetical protein